MRCSDGRHRDVRWHFVRGQLSVGTTTVRREVHSCSDGLQRNVPEWNSQLQRSLRHEQQRQFVRHIVRAMPDTQWRDDGNL